MWASLVQNIHLVLPASFKAISEVQGTQHW